MRRLLVSLVVDEEAVDITVAAVVDITTTEEVVMAMEEGTEATTVDIVGTHAAEVVTRTPVTITVTAVVPTLAEGVAVEAAMQRLQGTHKTPGSF